MQNRKRTICTLAGTFCLMIVIGAPGRVMGQENGNSAAQSGPIVGAWRTVVTTKNCETGIALGSLRGLMTFHRGGTFSEWGVVPGSSPALRGPGHGVWNREQGLQNYTYAFTHYLYDASGAYTGRVKVAGGIVYDASVDGFATDARVEVLNVNEEVFASFCSTVVGARLPEQQ